MNNLLQILRENKIARLLLVALVVFSFFAVFMHHHEAGENAHDCVVCRLAQLIVFTVVLGAVFLIGRAASAKYFFVREIPFFSPVRVSSLRNRAPPFSR